MKKCTTFKIPLNKCGAAKICVAQSVALHLILIIIVLFIAPNLIKQTV